MNGVISAHVTSYLLSRVPQITINNCHRKAKQKDDYEVVQLTASPIISSIDGLGPPRGAQSVAVTRLTPPDVVFELFFRAQSETRVVVAAAALRSEYNFAPNQRHPCQIRPIP